jgi:ubiquinone/menaquinone biosynthesis C-methylase UbiE
MKATSHRPVSAAENKEFSVWNDFLSFDVMRSPGRRYHWTRRHTYKTVRRLFGTKHYFRWLDIGVIGMVDYENLAKKLSFDYTGIDIGENILKDATRYLVDDSHKLCLVDINDDLQDINLKLKEVDKDEFDLITMRHVLNHCPYYEKPIFNAYHLLGKNGYLMINLHLSLLDIGEKLDHHYDWKDEGLVIGNRYNKLKFIQYLSKYFEIEEFLTFDDGKKPNNVFVCKKIDSLDTLRPSPAKEKIIKKSQLKRLMRTFFALFFQR